MDARRGVKLKLSPLCVSPEARDLFRDIIEKAHKVKTAAHLLAKLYILDRLHRNESLPKDLDELFCDVVSSLSSKKPRRNDTDERKQKLRDLLRGDFPSEAFCMNTEHLTGNWARYEASKYKTHVENHIKANFSKCLFAFVETELKLNRKDPLELMTIKRVIGDIETLGLDALPSMYCLPVRPAVEIDDQDTLLNTAEEDLPLMTIDAHVAREPLEYMASMLYMCGRLEHHGRIDKVSGVLPLIRSQVPGHTLIDTDILLDFMPKELLRGKTKRDFEAGWKTPNARGKQARDPEGNRRLIDGQAQLWSLVLKLERCQPRGNKLAFDNTIQTDGYSCNLLLRARQDQLNGKRRIFKQPPKKVSRQESLSPRLLAKSNIRVIGIDPGKNNLIYCVDDQTPVYDAEHRKLIDKGRTFRYTKAQRDFEMQKKRRRKKAERLKQHKCPEAKEWEAILRGHFSNTTDVGKFIRFIDVFLASRSAMQDFYSSPVHRRDRFESYRLRQKSESKLISDFKSRMQCRTKASRDRTLIAFGNGSRCNLRNSAPGPSSRLRRLFVTHRFHVIDIHEAYTSKRCFHCKDPSCENGPHRYHLPGTPDQRPAQVWGVRRCCGCDRPWNRDYHACLNIAYLAREIFHGRSRPSYLCM